MKSPTKRDNYEVERRVGSSDKLFETTNFKPSTSLKSGLLDIYKKIKLKK
jgi:hypothetical protein